MTFLRRSLKTLFDYAEYASNHTYQKSMLEILDMVSSGLAHREKVHSFRLSIFTISKCLTSKVEGCDSVLKLFHTCGISSQLVKALAIHGQIVREVLPSFWTNGWMLLQQHNLQVAPVLFPCSEHD